MNPDISTHLDALAALCRRFHVRRLEVFGSMATGRDHPGESDIDFLVEFDALAPADAADAYFGLLEALRDLFARRVDLVDASAIRNPYFRKSVDESKRLVYAAA